MINDFTRWRMIYTGNFQESRDSCRRYPIPEIFPVISPTSTTLLISCSSSKNWNLAGWLNQIIPLPFKPSYHYSHKCLLRNNLVILPDLGSEFKLSFSPISWLPDLKLEISEYHD